MLLVIAHIAAALHLRAITQAVWVTVGELERDPRASVTLWQL